MAYKFFNIGKANEEIDKLEAAVAKLTAERDAIKDNDSTIAAEAEKLKTRLASADAKVVQLDADLATARQSISSLTTERDAARSELATANAALANPEQRIKEAASVQAAQITASLGQPPIAAQPAAPPNPSAGLTGLERAIAAHKASQTTVTK